MTDGTFIILYATYMTPYPFIVVLKTVIRLRTLVPFIKERKKAKMCDDTAPLGGIQSVCQSAPWSLKREFHFERTTWC